MSKLIEIIRPEQSIKGFDAKNLNKSGLDALNEVYVEDRLIQYSDLIRTTPDVASIQPRGFGNMMSQREKFIIPEIFPLQSEKNFAGFQKFALPMFRLLGYESDPGFQTPAFQSIKQPYRVRATQNYASVDFYPYGFPNAGVNDATPDGVVVAFDAGAATKARFWRVGDKVIKYDTSLNLVSEQFYATSKMPLFECDVVPYERNYIYLFLATCVYPFILNSVPPLPFGAQSRGENIDKQGYSPLVRLELFSEDYSAQRFESGIAFWFEISNIQGVSTKYLVNVSNEQCVKIYEAFTSSSNGGTAISEKVYQYNETYYPNSVQLTAVVKHLNRYCQKGTPIYLQVKSNNLWQVALQTTIPTLDAQIAPK